MSDSTQKYLAYSVGNIEGQYLEESQGRVAKGEKKQGMIQANERNKLRRMVSFNARGETRDRLRTVSGKRSRLGGQEGPVDRLGGFAGPVIAS